VIEVTVGTRLVVVLGRGRLEVSAVPYVERAAERDIPLVVLTIGYPVSTAQQGFVAEAIDRAFGARVDLDAILVPDPAELTTHLTLEDEVTVHADSSDRRRIASVLARLRS
jgi:hypothetical protein